MLPSLRPVSCSLHRPTCHFILHACLPCIHTTPVLCCWPTISERCPLYTCSKDDPSCANLLTTYMTFNGVRMRPVRGKLWVALIFDFLVQSKLTSIPWEALFSTLLLRTSPPQVHLYVLPCNSFLGRAARSCHCQLMCRPARTFHAQPSAAVCKTW